MTEVEKAVVEVVRQNLPRSIAKKFPTDEKLRAARIYHDLKLWGDDIDALVWDIEDRLGIEIVSKLNTSSDDRPISPPEFWGGVWAPLLGLFPFYGLYKDATCRPEDYRPITVRQLIEVCKSSAHR